MKIILLLVILKTLFLSRRISVEFIPKDFVLITADGNEHKTKLNEMVDNTILKEINSAKDYIDIEMINHYSYYRNDYIEFIYSNSTIKNIKIFRLSNTKRKLMKKIFVPYLKKGINMDTYNQEEKNIRVFKIDTAAPNFSDLKKFINLEVLILTDRFNILNYKNLNFHKNLKIIIFYKVKHIPKIINHKNLKKIYCFS
jgi:hypothetical protein